VISIGAILFPLFAINLSGAFVYDSNFSVFHGPPDEVPRLAQTGATKILRSTRITAFRSAVPLMIVTAIWFFAAFMHLRRLHTGPKGLCD
jgi:hypothetical protein